MRERIRGRLENLAKDIIAEYVSGKTAKEVAALFDANIASINRLLIRHGIPRKENPAYRGRIIQKSAEKIIALHNDNLPPAKIAERLNLNRNAIAAFLRKRGIAPHKNLFWLGKKGSEHVQWRGGRVSKQKLFRNSVAYIRWRNKIFARDNYSCQWCGKHGGYLEAHHIVPLRDCIEDSRSLADSNGITLCRSCHAKTKGCEYDFIELFNGLIT